ncbi:protein FRA10AC1 [Cryptococcus bacillisporus CA1873]|uniref:Protein FRA10AC1 n=1 Tax=Cryptococcus bacillisporus CA1873 TaxID=1296111 RepID=A0ABR5BE63_CRYGA|nr:protein FRA10AC1 [Cryptococcus bacillisporus CA1873]|eukprot:KIR67472.1 protein FRA10AC1 [Cryptococcus gattii CA1873]
MSWKSSPGVLASGPPMSSSSNPVINRIRPNPSGLSAFQREALVSSYGPSSSIQPKVRTEWDVLKENHRFIRDDEEAKDVSWEERLARAYESKLFREFALSKKLALRWRTAPEVVNGIGEETCASLRCKYHEPLQAPSPVSDHAVGFASLHSRAGSTDRDYGWDYPGHDEKERMRKGKKPKIMPELKTFELPFVYMEAGERKEALVKVRVCPRCTAKLLWKPGQGDMEEDLRGEARSRGKEKEKGDNKGSRKDTDRRTENRDKSAEDGERRRRRKEKESERERSRSQSPRRHSRHHCEGRGRSHRHHRD